MTHGGAGALIPIMFLLALSLLVALSWIFAGPGIRGHRLCIGGIQIALLAISLFLFVGISHEEIKV
jgi:hypothetical protein